jgi:26S proteasome regulatory subunit N9
MRPSIAIQFKSKLEYERIINDSPILQVHLIEGIIDEVDSTVHVSWVQPRVLGIPQVKALRERLDAWVGKVHTTLLSVEAETPDLVAA